MVGGGLPRDRDAAQGRRERDQELSLRLDIDHAKLEPGSYNGLIEVRVPQAATTRTPVTLSRSENSVLWPIAIGAVAGLVAMLWYLVQKAVANVKRKVPLGWLFVAFLSGAAVGIVSALTAWLAQDVWTFEDNGWSAGVAAFTGATTGAMAVLLANIWEDQPVTGKEKVVPFAPPADPDE